MTHLLGGNGTEARDLAAADGAAPLMREVEVSVKNSMLAAALGTTAEEVGWRVVARRCENGLLVTDAAPARPGARPAGNGVILVCDTTSLGARRAMDAVSEFLAASVVCADQPSDLADALEAVAGHRITIPARVAELAAAMPELTERQLAILGGVMAGQSNSEISRGLYLSPASIKREMGLLYAALSISGRSAIVARALALGLVPLPVRP